MCSSLAPMWRAEKNYSYQHVQGLMLVRFNELAFELDLSHSEYRVMLTLIGLWNITCNMAYPTIEYLASNCQMSKVTVLKALNKLVETNLLIKLKQPGQRSKYYFSNLLLETASSTHVKPISRTACKTVHDSKHIKKKTDKNIASKKLSNDDFSIILMAEITKDNNYCLKIRQQNFRNKIRRMVYNRRKKRAILRL